MSMHDGVCCSLSMGRPSAHDLCILECISTKQRRRQRVTVLENNPAVPDISYKFRMFYT